MAEILAILSGKFSVTVFEAEGSLLGCWVTIVPVVVIVADDNDVGTDTFSMDNDGSTVLVEREGVVGLDTVSNEVWEEGGGGG